MLYYYFILIYLADINHSIEELNKKIDILESKIEKLDKIKLKEDWYSNCYSSFIWKWNSKAINNFI